ncbi:MAG: protein-L-isoaspartate(D-aspartate) O-methyltransferase [Betaproteobacteria bacterium]|nr:protein-L-isoaspartate(D-aspartate) O-methyltransferase [Betaproteobacteria bacterium]
MVAEVEAMYGETRGLTGLRAMSPRVRSALGRVERHRLIPAGQRALAYRNHPLPIGQGQTISQPYIVALSTDLIMPAPHHTVLEVGTGSGYQAAVLAEIVASVFSIEIIEALGKEAAQQLKKLGYDNIQIRIGDGYQGWPEQAPFDAIVVTAAAPRVPEALLAQLKPGGRMVIPVGASGEAQELLLIVKTLLGEFETKSILPVRFVPLVPGR